MPQPETTAPAAIGALELIQMQATDPVATADWYRNVLGATVQQASEYWARIRLGNVDVGIHQGTPPPAQGWEPGFRVLDIAATRVALEAHGTVTESYHDIPGGVKLAFQDPSGYVIAVYQYGTSVAELEGASAST